MTGVWDVVREVVVFIGIVNCVVFAVGYNYKSGGTWKQYPMGRYLMGSIASLGVAFAALEASLLWGPLGPVAWSVVLLGINGFLIQGLYLLFTRRWRSRDSAPSEDTLAEEYHR